MKLKYYLRGLGTGMLMTTLIMVAAYSYRDTTENRKFGSEEQSTENEESSSTSDIDIENSSSTEEMSVDEKDSSTNDSSAESSSTEESSTEEQSAEEPSTEEPSTEEPSTEEQTTEKVKVELIIYSGNTSDVVASRLMELGVISDAADFDRYLCENNLDGRICTGVYTITIGLSYEEIAEIFTY